MWKKTRKINQRKIIRREKKMSALKIKGKGKREEKEEEVEDRMCLCCSTLNSHSKCGLGNSSFVNFTHFK